MKNVKRIKQTEQIKAKEHLYTKPETTVDLGPRTIPPKK